MKKILSIIIIFNILSTQCAKAAEGLWLPVLLKQYNMEEMQQLGFKLTADDIYNINQSCLKDAVVGFVRLNRPFHHFCSGEVISAQGLVLTNHHCGIGTVQAHSTEEHDYLKDGFWAMNLNEELTGQNIGVCFLKRMEDVTHFVLSGVTDKMTEMERDSVIQWNIGVVESQAQEGNFYLAHVDAFFGGNEYYLSVYEIFSDVRLVGVPPIGIGKFGGDTDNWMWPRHTGDFTLFRIYANKDNQPAVYSPENVPYKPANHLQISLNGVKEGDFTMVLGYPGTTNEYMSSKGIALTEKVNNPITINVRTKLLSIMDKAMEANPALRLKYTEKAAGMANTWKKLIGENLGLHRKDVVAKKIAYELELTQWIKADSLRNKKYGHLHDDYNRIYQELKEYEETTTWLNETLFSSDLIEFAGSFQHFLAFDKNSTVAEIDEYKRKMANATEKFFSQYDISTDLQLFTAIIAFYQQGVKAEWQPKTLSQANIKFTGNPTAYGQRVFNNTMFTSKEKILDYIKKYKPSHNKLIWKDPVFAIYSESIHIYFDKIAPKRNELNNQLVRLNRLMIEACRAYQPERKFYPDANSTFRVSYGQVFGYQPADAIKYKYCTTLTGIMEKDNPDIYDYVVPAKLKQLYQQNDFGRYANADGSMPICFIATSHTTGGNSGSPVLNAEGQLIGTNFDRVWEGTMSDLNYDPTICRNISLDIRYTLFIIDKYAGASYLLNEMDIAP